MIKEFQGEYRWLSNFAPVPIRLENRTYASVEHAYMSMKNHSSVWKDFCAQPGISPGLVKKESRKIDLREDWELIKLSVMEDLVRIKFSSPKYRDKLLATGNQNIQEGNRWNDKFFGICLKTGEGENHLGRIIMKIREELIY